MHHTVRRTRRLAAALLFVSALTAPSANAAFAQGVSIGGPFEGEAGAPVQARG